jgi:hypothetical protein
VHTHVFPRACHGDTVQPCAGNGLASGAVCLPAVRGQMADRNAEYREAAALLRQGEPLGID